MIILLADREPALGRLIGNMLESDGHRVIVVQEGMAASGAFKAPSRVELAVLDAQLPLKSGIELLKQLRALEMKTPVVITSDRTDERIREVLAPLGVAKLFPRPFDAFALTDLIRELTQKAPAPVPLPMDMLGGVALENLMLVKRIWQGRLSGTLKVEKEQCRIGAGAPVEAAGRELVRAALYSGKAVFEEHPVEGEGVRAILAEALYRAATQLNENLPDELVLVPQELTDLGEFPISLGNQSILRGATGRCTVGILARAAGGREEIRRIISTLLALGFFFVEGADGRPRHRWQGGGGDLQALVARQGPKSDLKSIPGRSLHQNDFGRTRAQEPRPPEPRPAERISGSPVQGNSHEVSWTPRSDLSNAQPAKASGNQPKATSSSDVVIAAPSDSGVRSTERTTELTDRGRNPVGEILRSSLTIEQHRTILQREVQTLAHASPWTILGIPQDVPAERLTKAGERMLSRYQQLLSHSDAGIRELAGQVLERVQWAIANATLAAPIERLDRLESFEAPGEDEGPFQAGFQQAEAACWAAADQAFSKARALSPGSARNLAWLGWARLQNPQVPLEKREEEGMEYLRLAEQFDPENVESRWFLATVYAKRGETDAAIRRLSRVLILQPHHAEAAALLKKLRQGEKK